MDFPPFNHHHNHHNRYTPIPPPTNFPEPNNHHHNNNLYHNHNPPISSPLHLLHPPLSYAPPPPPPPPYPLPPPPPHFTFLDPQSNPFDYRPDPTLYSPTQHSQPYFKPHTRFIDNNNNINNDGSSSYQPYGIDKRFGIDNKFGIEDYVEKYEPRYLTENERVWGHEEKYEPTKWVMNVKKNDSGRERDEGREFSRFDRVRDGREGREEFKQVQKKSVLLRIGKPNGGGGNKKKRNYEQHSSKAYIVESDRGFETSRGKYRGKEKVEEKDRDRDYIVCEDSSLRLDGRVEGERERGREGSPVELDVSFKSNALVAKPVVTPSSPMSDGNYTQDRSRKGRRVTDSEFGSPLSKISERLTRSRSSSRGVDSPSSSEKGKKQPVDKDSVFKGVKSSLLGSVLEQGDGDGGSKGPLSFRLKKKRKVVNPGSSSFNFQLGVKDNNKGVKGENLKSIVIAPIPDAIPNAAQEEPSPKPAQEKPTPKPAQEKPTPKPAQEKPTPKPAQEKPSPKPAQENSSPKPGQEEPSPKPAQEKPSPKPAQEEPSSSKVDKSPLVVVSETDGSEAKDPNLHCMNSSGDDSTENKKLTEHDESLLNDGLANDINQQPCENVVSPSLEDGGSKAPLSFRLKKKRKLINPGSSSFNFQLAVKTNKDVTGAGKNNIPIAPFSEAIPFPTLEKTVSSKVDISPLAIVSEKDGSEGEDPSLHCMNSFGDTCTENKSLTAQNVSMIKDGLALGNDLNQQPCENELLPTLEIDTRNISTDSKLSPGGTEISTTSEHDQKEIQKSSTESYAIVDVANVLNNLQDESVGLKETNASVDVANVSNNLQNESVSLKETSASVDVAYVSNNLQNESVSLKETNTIADTNALDSCSHEIVIISSESSDDQGFDGVSRKEDERGLIEVTSNQISFNRPTEFLEDDSKEYAHTVIIAEQYATGCTLHKDHSFDKDAITDMVNSISTSIQMPSPDYREPITDAKDELPPSSSIVSTFADAGAFATDSNDKLGESMPDILTSSLSSKKVSSFVDSQMLTSKSTDKKISNLSVSENDGNPYVKSVSKDVALLNAPKTGIKTSRLKVTNAVSSASQGSNVKTIGSNTNLQGSNLPFKKPSSMPAVPSVFAARSSPVLTNSRINKTATITKPRTWHRASSNPAPAPLPPKKIVTSQNSYIRTGNSLVRKGTPVTAIASRPSVYQPTPPGPIEARSSAGPGNKVNNTYTRVAGSSAPVVRPKTPPLSGSTKFPDCPTSLRDLSPSPVEILPASAVEGSFVVQKVSEDQIRTSANSESQKVVDEAVKGNKMQYVKTKSNQLIAASRSDQPIQELDKTQTSSSDSYYKRIKNQLIRTSVGTDSVNTEKGKASKNTIKRQSGKGISKKYKHLRFPSVWTLNSQSLGKDGASLRQKLRPQLLPWKRARNWGTLMNHSDSIPSNSSSSFISRKLLLSRKRDTIYTRSKHGFSLRMSKLLSVGGASLKWSKSIEKNSKRTNEEATLAVAAAEKRKRELHGTASVTAELKSRNNTSRGRIFRIGLVKYKMDPSRRTLQRISDEETSTSMQSKEEIRKCYVPKRLKIGHDEYVRIGNGNQLVRNPKRRTRMFANEKVRWSLHTARSRLAKKKKFCQFFTRFGKCNKEDGKCPYIHDSSKIAVCTKFLNGLCSNPNCKLTHKVIPERMQDCSYYLQGLCSNKHCPYRHVNVNSAASICEGFLKGYCADGDECRKKHSYACPVFEATGTCPQGTKCKLHHPKNQLKKKQQNSTEHHQKNSRGRYFGSVSGEEVKPVSEKQYLKSDDVDDDVGGGILCQDGMFAEYISLDSGNEEAGEVTSGQRTRFISEPLGLGADELTKPTGIMNRVVLDR